MKSVVLVAVIVLLTSPVLGQDACRSVPYKQTLAKQDPAFTTRLATIESFTQQWIARKQTSVNDLHSPGTDLHAIKIPVVVHVIFNSAAQNISDAQILSQLDVLNRDYGRQNSDTSKTPLIFRDVAADCEIQFVLAGTDPAGKQTNGIIRKHTSVISFDIDDHIKYSASGGDDAWNSDNYLNIWVGNLSFGLLGYASIPGSSKDKDGVVIAFNAFGTVGAVSAPFDRGRTATHEVGHWLNLIHIWGDADCGTDLVDDTPPQKAATRGCPGTSRVTCGSGPYGDMFMNYMDFTNDACMNIFTEGQKARMRSLFAPGGFREALLNSAAASGVSGNPIISGQVQEPASDRSLRIFPNPASSMISVQVTDTLSGPLLLGVFNSTGQKIMQIRVTQKQQQVNVSTLQPGVYYVRSENGNSVRLARLVKM